ncbi:MAG: SDR family oxidoreductase [Holophagae bacterium]|jgi:NAD(P)-dependent dehydrogenase (short-subunit alcohol dehydrogenase family)
MDFTGKNVLVTGGSRGIGRACAVGFAERGARVAINYRANRDAAEATLASLSGGGHVALQADVAVPEAAAMLVDDAVDALVGLDIVVNNAGIFFEHKLDEVSYDEWQDAWQRVLAANLIGPANVSYCAARHMIDRGRGGRIVNVSSRGSFRGEPEGPAYGASKAGLNSMSQSLAKRLAPHGIAVGVVAPGFVDTEMAARYRGTPMWDDIMSQSPFGRIATPEEVAAAVLFLASDEAVFSTGAIIDVNGASYLRT